MIILGMAMENKIHWKKKHVRCQENSLLVVEDVRESVRNRCMNALKIAWDLPSTVNESNREKGALRPKNGMKGLVPCWGQITLTLRAKGPTHDE